uniref:Uncharacterized protein n=1 Tax=Triticum urartu TaxID=4572 RepID=A0A8R7UNL9_TRIUA
MSETEGKKALTTLIIYSSNNTIGDRNDKLTQIISWWLLMNHVRMAQNSPEEKDRTTEFPHC